MVHLLANICRKKKEIFEVQRNWCHSINMYLWRQERKEREAKKQCIALNTLANMGFLTATELRSPSLFYCQINNMNEHILKLNLKMVATVIGFGAQAPAKVRYYKWYFFSSSYAILAEKFAHVFILKGSWALVEIFFKYHIC